MRKFLLWWNTIFAVYFCYRFWATLHEHDVVTSLAYVFMTLSFVVFAVYQSKKIEEEVKARNESAE